ncbi:hypothetical protein [Streptomyces sp. NPDC049881]|uniref:hypothetical protein n=1 Tax=Streptomyces sp. NPDC049881 TaxID=3155778 RepID=UPI00341BEE28
MHGELVGDAGAVPLWICRERCVGELEALYRATVRQGGAVTGPGRWWAVGGWTAGVLAGLGLVWMAAGLGLVWVFVRTVARETGESDGGR